MEINRRTGKGDLGDMNQRVQFKLPLKSRNADTNEEIKTYVISSAVWAGIEYSERSTEDEVASRKTELVYVTFTMYFRDAVRPTWRIVYRDAEFEIESILPDVHRQFMKVEAVQREPWRDDYYTSEESGYWTDQDGNFWVAVNRAAATQPTFGGLTFTNDDGDTWTVT